VPIIRRDFSLTLQGQLTVPFEGAFEIHAKADAGVRLRLNGATVVDGWSPGDSHEGRVEPANGKPMAFELEYLHGCGVASLSLHWRAAGGGEWTQVPAGALSTATEDRDIVEARFGV